MKVNRNAPYVVSCNREAVNVVCNSIPGLHLHSPFLRFHGYRGSGFEMNTFLHHVIDFK